MKRIFIILLLCFTVGLPVYSDPIGYHYSKEEIEHIEDVVVADSTLSEASIDSLEFLLGVARDDSTLQEASIDSLIALHTAATVDSILIDALDDLWTVRESAGEADIDITGADYTDYVNIMTITASATGLIDCTIDLDFDKQTTGWNDVATHGDLLDVIIVKQVDGTNYRSTQFTSAQITSAATLTSTDSGVSFRIGALQANCSVQVHVRISVERNDSEQPYRVTSIGAAPTISAVAIP